MSNKLLIDGQIYEFEKEIISTENISLSTHLEINWGNEIIDVIEGQTYEIEDLIGYLYDGFFRLLNFPQKVIAPLSGPYRWNISNPQVYVFEPASAIYYRISGSYSNPTAPLVWTTGQQAATWVSVGNKQIRTGRNDCTFFGSTVLGSDGKYWKSMGTWSVKADQPIPVKPLGYPDNGAIAPFNIEQYCAGTKIEVAIGYRVISNLEAIAERETDSEPSITPIGDCLLVVTFADETTWEKDFEECPTVEVLTGCDCVCPSTLSLADSAIDLLRSF